MSSPNILLVMTDEERYPPPYESDSVAAFRRRQMPARERIRGGGVEFHRHYAGSTACVPSRATLFTGQYPSLHGVSQTDGIAKQVMDPAMQWLDPDEVPTLGDWFRAGGYQTHYRGKWHMSHANLSIPGGHEGLMASDDEGHPIPRPSTRTERRIDSIHSGSLAGSAGSPTVPRRPTAAPCETACSPSRWSNSSRSWRRPRSTGRGSRWPRSSTRTTSHSPAGCEKLLGFGPPDDSVPDISEAPSQADSFEGRPACQEAFKWVWPKMVADQPVDVAYRRLYYYLHKVVDQAIGRILDALEASGMADDTIVVFTSDHGDLLGAHGGLQQKWYNAFDEAMRVPLFFTGPGIASVAGGVSIPTSHVDLIPTLMGLAGIDVERATAGVAAHHAEARPLSGRDLSGLLTGTTSAPILEPIYFMTEDDVTRGSTQSNLLNGAPFDAVAQPSSIESVIASLPTGDQGGGELWKLDHYYERLDEWNADHGAPVNPFAAPPAEPVFELHNLTTDPEERTNRVGESSAALIEMTSILDAQRDVKRLVPSLRNP